MPNSKDFKCKSCDTKNGYFRKKDNVWVCRCGVETVIKEEDQ